MHTGHVLKPYTHLKLHNQSSKVLKVIAKIMATALLETQKTSVKVDLQVTFY